LVDRNQKPGVPESGGQEARGTTGVNRTAPPLDDLYREVVLDHYRHPRGRAPLSHPDRSVEGFNPACGDQIHLALEIEDGRVKESQVDCRGCSISVASGSMMAEMIRGRDLDEVKRLIEAVKGMMKGKPVDPAIDLADVEALEGVRKFPVRVKCALLAWTTLDEALALPSGRDTENPGGHGPGRE
jgi:nitrogen fixation NifU-like protein